jgi:hypothetical protein
MMHYNIDDASMSGSQTWEETGSKKRPVDVAHYDLAQPYHPDKANMDWKVTSITVSMIGPYTFEFFDQNGFCLNAYAQFWGRLPMLDEILTFLQEME